MKKHFLKFRKVFTNIAFSPLLLISNNSELAAKYLPNEVKQSSLNIEKNNIKNAVTEEYNSKKEKNWFSKCK